MKEIIVELCMGSSCFARGNSDTLEAVEKYVEEHGLQDRVKLLGHLCLDHCSEGPNVRIAGKSYHKITAPVVIDLIDQALREE